MDQTSTEAFRACRLKYYDEHARRSTDTNSWAFPYSFATNYRNFSVSSID